MIIAICNAFCPAAQLARSLLEFGHQPLVSRLIVVNGHYPRHYENNQRDLKLVFESFACKPWGYECEWWDPGEDLGSAQGQNWALERLVEEGKISEGDYFINLDPDACCRTNWIGDAKYVLDLDPRCVVLSCNAPMVEGFVSRRNQEMELRMTEPTHTHAGIRILVPDIPTPFNFSLWRFSFIRAIGGIPQKFPMYGEVEGPVYNTAFANGYYIGYLKDHMENEDGKLMHDRSFEDWKDAHARTHTFLGNFREYCLSNNLLGD